MSASSPSTEADVLENDIRELRDAKPGELARRLIERGWTRDAADRAAPAELDAAWAAVEAALPEGWAFRITGCNCDMAHMGRWRISSGPDLLGSDPEIYVEDTPAAALNALADRLRGSR